MKVREFTDCAADVVHHRVVDLIDLMRVWRADILLALLGPSASGFQGFRPFRLPQLAPTCGPAAVLRRVSLHDEDVGRAHANFTLSEGGAVPILAARTQFLPHLLEHPLTRVVGLLRHRTPPALVSFNQHL